MAPKLMLAVVIYVSALLISASADDGRRHVRFEYKLSFKGPHLKNKQNKIPFWAHSGSAIPSEDQVRLTTSLRDQRGAVWAKTKNVNEFWEVEIQFKVSGRGRVGGDGLALWYTSEIGNDGPVFGNIDNWKGMGLFFDSFDNDNQQNNPYIMVVLNNGSTSFNHFGDGLNQQLGGCMRDFRNRPHPVKAKIRYYNNVLTVFYHNGMTNSDDYELCMRSEGVYLPAEGFFGISAATGGLADDHDVYKFLTYSLRAPVKEEGTKSGMSDEERQKLADQYGEYATKLEKQKEEFQSAHPEKFKRDDEKFETIYDRNVRLIFEGQKNSHQLVSALHQKAIELTTQINNLHDAFSADRKRMETSGGGTQGGTAGQGISRQEINTMITMQNDLVKSVNELKLSISNIRNAGDNNAGKAVHGESIEELRRNARSILENVGHLVTSSQFAGKKSEEKEKSCPKINCIGPGYFVLFLTVQVTLIAAYVFYKNHQEQSAKKFY